MAPPMALQVEYWIFHLLSTPIESFTFWFTHLYLYILNTDTQTPGGSADTTLPAGTKITKNPDGSISLGGKVLPPGTSVQTNPDGSISVKGIVLDIPREN